MSTSDEDRLAFLAAMGDVRLHRSRQRVTVKRAPPAPVARSTLADERAVMLELLSGPVDIEELEHGDTLSYRAQGVQEGVIRRLRRGHYRIDGNLDLHGYNRHQARLAVIDFLAECHDRMRRCVRIVHGKGNGSPIRARCSRPTSTAGCDVAKTWSPFALRRRTTAAPGRFMCC